MVGVRASDGVNRISRTEREEIEKKISNKGTVVRMYVQEMGYL